MGRQFTLGIFILFLMGASIPAQEMPEIQVEEMDFCTGIEQRGPVGVDTVFADTIGQVYCYTKIANAPDTTSISHVWYYQNKRMAEVNLDVKAKSWRTWSSKRILTEWTGRWRVDVVDANGNILKSKFFSIQ